MVDKDKDQLDYLKTCEKVFVHPMLVLWKYPGKPHYIIQLDPPLEKWILKLFDESDNRIEQYGYSADSKQLKRQLKDDIDSEENEKLKKLINKIVSVDHPVIQKLKTILLYLKERTLNADMEELKRTLLN